VNNIIRVGLIYDKTKVEHANMQTCKHANMQKKSSIFLIKNYIWKICIFCIFFANSGRI